jgi:DNA-binding CsgD family transcriptional regulator
MAVLGLMLMFQADFGAARVQFAEALTLRQGKRDNMVDGWLLRGLGVIASGEGDEITARSLLEQALDVFRAHGDFGGLAVALLGLGDLALRQGERTVGRAYLEEAVTRLAEGGQLGWHAVGTVRLHRPLPTGVLEEIGPTVIAGHWRAALGRDMPPALARGATSMRRSGSLSPSTDQEPVAGGLTPREREVLVLLARHYSNREVAKELVLSIRTVEHHVANICAKLGVSSRRLAIAYAPDLGVPMPD